MFACCYSSANKIHREMGYGKILLLSISSVDREKTAMISKVRQENTVLSLHLSSCVGT